jgi:carbon storage regulator
MLVLTRRRDQGIHIGPDVRIVVLEVSGEQVRIGIDAPASKSILRDEVFDRIAKANSEAARHAEPATEPQGEET